VTALNIYVAANSDDAEEFNAPAVPGLESTDLDFYSQNDMYVGMRFQGLTIPPGSTILTAIIRMIAKTSRTGTGHRQTIACEDTDDAGTFTTASGNLSTRTPTDATINWTSGNTSSGSPYDTDDFAAVLQEIIDRPGWASGQAVAFIFRGSGVRDHAQDCYSYDNGSNFEQLRITYTSPVGGYALVF